MGSNEFSIGISSNLDYEELTVQIYYNDDYLAEINMDKGKEHMEIEIMTPDNANFWTFQLDTFIKLLKSSKCELLR